MSPSKAPRAPKFRRVDRAERRDALIAATLRCLRQFGHEGVSVRRISAEAGVSMGLINHHFPGSASLVAASYASLANECLDATEQHAASAPSGAGARERLGRFFEAYYAPEVLDPGLFRIWLVFWSLMAHSPEMRAVHDETSKRNRAALEGLFRRLRREPGVVPFRVASAAIGLSALMDGLWVAFSLNPSTFKVTDAVDFCNDWVAALAAGAFPGLRSRTAVATPGCRPNV